MKKNLFFAALALVAFASCADNEYVGSDDNFSDKMADESVISFTSGTKAITRGDHMGADAANLLNKQFIVSGFKGDGTTMTQVFDNYIVNWVENTAATTESNTADWEYVGKTAVALSKIAGTQTIKYWDYGTTQYDFAAFSPGTAEIITSGTPSSGEVLVTPITKSDTYAGLTYTIQGTATDLAKCYISDMVTHYKTGASMTPDAQPAYQQEVKLSFRNLACKVRVALYETIPGYSVKDVKFYTDNSTGIDHAANATTVVSNATLFAPNTAASDAFFTGGKATISFSTIGSSNVSQSDYNKAHITFSETNSSETIDFGSLNLTGKEDREKSENVYIGRKSTEATFAGSSGNNNNYYFTVLPNETGTVLELRIDYTLLATDGSGETINVHGATAYVPAHYAAWKPNYAYTYIFKISDNTNGWTSTSVDDPASLYPITFDAVVVDSQEHTQSTITTVATPTITTYQVGHVYSEKDEYSASKGDIYVQAMDNSTTPATLITNLNKTTSPTHLWKVEKASNAKADISEATVMDAINFRESYKNKILMGRNGLKLTLMDDIMDTEITSIPKEDGNTLTVNAGEAAKFTPEANGAIYAFVYTVKDNGNTWIPTAFDFSSATQAPDDWSTSTYYTDKDCTIAAGDFVAGYYYKKVTNYNIDMAVKVIKVAAAE